MNMKKSRKEIILEIMRSPEKQLKYYLRFGGEGAELLAEEIYTYVLTPKGW